MRTLLRRIYGDRIGALAYARLSTVLENFAAGPPTAGRHLFTERDALLITYGDTLLRKGQPPLQTLQRFCNEHLGRAFSCLHILPFFPYSSDDGFAVMDFEAVRPDLGDWSDIMAIGRDFRLMVDLVVNHVSAQSAWFRSYLAQQPGFTDLAIAVDPAMDLSLVTRPRTSPLLTPFDLASGRPVHVWTTFGADQIDLNYRSLDVLERMVRVLLQYVSRGARIIRLDAIAYLWKEIGTACVHLPQTHDMVRLLRRILDRAAPEVVLVTETNVPHAENISYFGHGGDEAQAIYNFSLPPLLLHGLTTGTAGILRDWLRTWSAVSDQTIFFNFTASHDGIGIRPLEGILTSRQIQTLIERIIANGGLVSERRNADGSTSAYELNITYLDALNNPTLNPDPLHMARFLASQAVALALPGVPAVYIHSLLGTRNWSEGVRQTGRPRSINRRRLEADALSALLADAHSTASQIYSTYLKMVRLRCRQPAFHPAAPMQVLDLDDRVLALRRYCPAQTLYALTNFSTDTLTVPLSHPAPPDHARRAWVDVLSNRTCALDRIELTAYQTIWLRPSAQ